MALSLGRQILEFFFIQTEGFKPSNLCDELFEGERKYEFQRTLENGEPDKTYINIARAMVALLDVGVTIFNDRLFFNAMSYSPDQMRETFAIIFDVMNRGQHYQFCRNHSQISCRCNWKQYFLGTAVQANL